MYDELANVSTYRTLGIHLLQNLYYFFHIFLIFFFIYSLYLSKGMQQLDYVLGANGWGSSFVVGAYTPEADSSSVKLPFFDSLFSILKIVFL